MKPLCRSYDKNLSTIRWMKQTQLQLKLSPVKTKAIHTWTCVRLLLQRGTHSGVSAESASQLGSKTGLRLLFWLCRARGESSLSVERLHGRSTTVAVDLPLFARIFLQLLVLDGGERLFGHDQAPSKCLPQQQVSRNILFSPLALLTARGQESWLGRGHRISLHTCTCSTVMLHVSCADAEVAFEYMHVECTVRIGNVVSLLLWTSKIFSRCALQTFLLPLTHNLAKVPHQLF